MQASSTAYVIALSLKVKHISLLLRLNPSLSNQMRYYQHKLFLLQYTELKVDDKQVFFANNLVHLLIELPKDQHPAA
jgi:hypothetical protein